MGRKPKDLAGQVFGRLTAIAPTHTKRSGCYVWRCRCDCGKEAFVNVKDLVSGNTRSCGCMWADSQHARIGSHNSRMKKKKINNLSGQRFGKLTAIEPTGETRSGSSLWRCLCTCGNEKITTAFCLVYGRTKYCEECGKKRISTANIKRHKKMRGNANND